MFEMLLKQMGIDKLAEEFPNPEVFTRAASGALCKFVLETAASAGPPDDFAERFSLTAEQASSLYNAVLRAAIRRTTA